MNKKFKKYIIIAAALLTITITLVIIGFLYIDIKQPKDITPLIKEVTSNAKLIDANSDHNQALDVSEYAVSKGIKIPPVMINFDTHSDVYLNYPVLEQKSAEVGNWINEYLAKNPDAEELYWVMPKAESNNFNLKIEFADNDFYGIKNSNILYGNSLNQLPPLHFVIYPLDKKPFIQQFLMDPKTGIMNEISEIPQVNNVMFDPKIKYKKIKIITCTEDTLPDFTGKKVFLSIDADYTSNSGFDTLNQFKIIKNKKEMHNTVYSIFETLNKKHVKPEIISLTLSPQYLPVEQHKFISDFFQQIIKISGKKDEITTYKRKYFVAPKHIK